MNFRWLCSLLIFGTKSQLQIGSPALPLETVKTNMEYRTQSNGWQTFHEHFGFPIIIFICLMATFFTGLSGDSWIGCYAASFVLMVLGACLIGWAKLPIYRGGRFLTFGLKSVPRNLQGYYRWGWGLFFLGVGLALCLLLSNV